MRQEYFDSAERETYRTWPVDQILDYERKGYLNPRNRPVEFTAALRELAATLG